MKAGVHNLHSCYNDTTVTYVSLIRLYIQTHADEQISQVTSTCNFLSVWDD